MQEIVDDATSTKAMHAEPQAWCIMTLFGPKETITSSAMLIQNLRQKMSQDNVLSAM